MYLPPELLFPRNHGVCVGHCRASFSVWKFVYPHEPGQDTCGGRGSAKLSDSFSTWWLLCLCAFLVIVSVLTVAFSSSYSFPLFSSTLHLPLYLYLFLSSFFVFLLPLVRHLHSLLHCFNFLVLSVRLFTREKCLNLKYTTGIRDRQWRRGWRQARRRWRWRGDDDDDVDDGVGGDDDHDADGLMPGLLYFPRKLQDFEIDIRGWLRHQ